jgi:hypothetical protein
VLNPAPETLICETVTLEFPLFVSVTACMLLVPTNTFPKLKLVGLAVSWSVAATPVPLKAMAVGEFGALLTSDTLPVTLPVAAGAKATLKFAVCPTASVKGRVSPLVLKPAPVTVAWEIVRLALPELVRVTVWVFVVPTTTLPKLTLVGVTESCGWTPVPLRAMAVGEFGALLTSDTLPVTLPVAAGVNPTLKLLD